ncbi:MAG: hypothetical protein QF510_03770 [Rhodospirillales bacterium]|nr:hypothetical protein [Rhodospirillales bacterium]
MNWVVGKCFNCRVFEVKGMVHVGTGDIERRPYAVIDGCDNVLRYECEQTANEKKGYIGPGAS